MIQMSSFQIAITPSRRAAARFIAHVRRTVQKALAEEEANGGVRQADIARSIGVNRSVINREIRGHKDLTLGRLAEIAWAMGREPTFDLVLREVPKGTNAHIQAQPENPFKQVSQASSAASVSRAPEVVTIDG